LTGTRRGSHETVWKTRKLADLVLIKTLLYTGVRVSELVAIRLDDVDFDRCQIDPASGTILQGDSPVRRGR
jgi:integrase